MAVINAFTENLAAQGIAVEPAVLPSPEEISVALDRVDEWFWALDPGVREGYDEGTGEERLCWMLADPSIDVAPELAGLLDAYDNTSGQTLSQMLAITRECLRAAYDQEGVG